MKVLVFDRCLRLTGHRIPYASLVAQSYEEHQVVVGIPDILRKEKGVPQYFPSPISIDFFETKIHKRAMASAFESKRCLSKLVQKHQPDLIAIPTADGLAFALGVSRLLGIGKSFANCPIDACLMRGGGGQQGQSKLKRLFAEVNWWVTRRGPWQRLMLIDPRAWSQLGAPHSHGVHLCPDPVPKRSCYTKHDARRALGLPQDGRLIVSVGLQDRRKGTDHLLAAFAKSNLRKTDRLLLAGKISSEIKPQLQKAMQDHRVSDRILLLDRYITELEFASAIDASDVVAVPYRSADRPSGIVSRAIAWERPILANNAGWLKWIVDQLDVGFTTRPEDSDTFAISIEDALEKSDTYQASSHAVEYTKFNTEDAYQIAWSDGLNFDMNTMPSSSALSFLDEKI